MKILITGGSGFIGSNLISYILDSKIGSVINVDSLTYAGNTKSLEDYSSNPNYVHEQINICNEVDIKKCIFKHEPTIIMHLAAESHVDRSIEDPSTFIKTNIFGTYVLLQESLTYFKSLNKENAGLFRFHHISTDEVYGDLENLDEFFTEHTSYNPSSPYSASKASSDHLVRAWHKTFELPILITNCSNNYGPYHFPEKFIPHIILSALNGKNIPIYGDGLQIRDWLYVEDHVKALIEVVLNGKIGETYNIGGRNEKSNIEVAKLVCSYLEKLAPSKKTSGVSNYHDLITFVSDRPGHDKRYAIDASKIINNLDWVPKETFESGLYKTVEWYLDNSEWVKDVLSGDYILERLGEKDD